MKEHPIFKAAVARTNGATVAHIDLVDTAKLIRHVLKQRFPDVKFSVRSDRYAGGSSIDVRYFDGPLQGAVQEIIAPYASSGFDGMIDMAYCKGAWLYPDGSAGYRSTQGTAMSCGTVEAYNRPATSRDAIPARFGPSYVFANREHTPAGLARVLEAYATQRDDELAAAIKAGAVTVKASTYGGKTYGHVDGARTIRVWDCWGDQAIHCFEQEGRVAA